MTHNMKRWMLAAVIAVALILATVGNGAAEAASGDVIGTYRGVDAYSNGANAGTGSGPYEYQCVAYVKRFYRDAMGMDTSSWTGNGDMYYDSASAKGLDAYPNGGSVPPQPDDILTFNGPTYGHVAIITEVGDTYVNVIEQNWNRNTAYATLAKTGNNLPDRSGYHIQGWLRKPGAHILDQSISPTIVAHGDELTFVYNIDNPYPDNIENVRLGAQIRTNDPQGAWIDDPANDDVVTLLPGAHDHSRTFIVPQTASSGFYDARWIILDDVSGDWIDSKEMIRIFELEETTIEFSGYEWMVKSSNTPVGPGPNYFSGSSENVWVDGQGQLHLKIVERDGKWYCAEVYTTESLGYGKYIFYVANRVDQLDKNVVGGLFTWDDAPEYNHREIDIEFSRWGDENNDNSLYTVQSGVLPNPPENFIDFNLELNGDYSTHNFAWQSNRVSFQSIHGHYDSPPDPSYVIESWDYYGGDNPIPGNEKVHINLWLIDTNEDDIGDPPSNGQEAEIIIKSFEYVPVGGRSGGPDDFGYIFIDSNKPEGPAYDWIEISGTGTEVLPNSDDSWVENIGLGFFFNYYGTDYSQLAISNNGLLFSGGTTWQYINAPITQTPGVHGFIAPFWDDIVTWGSGTIYYQTIGTYPNRMFVVEWYDNQHYHSSTSGVTFEAILYEGSNNILFQYKDVDFGNVYGAVSGDNPPYDNGGSATVGIEGPAGDDGLQYSFNEPVIDPSLAILFKFPQFSGTNLYLSKQAPASKDRGSTMTYTLHYHNFGDTPAQNVVLEDTLPAEVEFISASDSGSYDSNTRKVTWNIGSVTPSGHGYETVSVRIPQSVQIGTVIQNDASISTSNLEVRYDDNDAHAQTTVTGSSLPPDVGVEPNNGGTGAPSIYWHNPITFSYQNPTATGVDIRIQVNDGGPDITGSMTGGPPDWTYTTTFYPRHGRATVTYTVSGESCQAATTPTLPSTIRVLRTETGQVEVVDFKEYVKNVLPNEWISSWNMDALKAGAMAGKTYAWYWTIHQKYPGQDYDVKDTIGDQVYIPGTANSRTDQAVEETWNRVMTKNGEIFEAQYDSGTPGSPDPLYAGRMSQWGTQYWAEQEKDWQWIVHNYYDPVEGPCVPSVTFDIYIDPAGYIYDADTGERIADATVWLQWPDGEGGWVNVPTDEDPAIMQPDVNPQITGQDGWYQWDVLEGSYRVHVEADGYYPEDSIVVSIPPPVTDLHVGLTRIPSENEPPDAMDDSATTLEDTAVTINVTANDNDVDGNLDPTTANTDCTTCSGPAYGTLTNYNNGTFTYTPDPDYNGPDSFTYEICDTDGLCDTATVTIDITAVNDLPEISVDVTEQTVQYSNGIADITISATDIDSSSLTISTIWNKDGGTIQPDLPPALMLSAGDSLPPTWVWILEGQALVDAGTYNVMFTISDGEDEIEAYTTLIVEPEDAAVAFDDTNLVAVQVAEPGGNSEAFSLTVDVTEAIPDMALLAYPGDISLAEVSMTLVPVGPGSPAEPTSCLLEVVGTGYDAILTVTCEFNDVAVNTYAVQVTVDGGYYTGTGEDVVVIYDPSLGFTTGGGTFLWPETGEKTNFGYTMRYNKKATNIKGNLLLVRHLQDGTIYRVKSNALYGLALGESEDDGETYGWASFSGKSTYLEPGWDEPIGNHEFITYVVDHGEPGKNVDRIWIKIMNQGNTIDVMSMDDPGANNAVVINGGNIVVPHK